MTILKIHTLPDPILKQPAAPVSVLTPDIVRLAHDMLDTIRHHTHCVGVAAPQIGRSLRIVVIDVSLHHKPHRNHGALLLINPVITASSGKQKGREGCLSVPDLTGTVVRAERISVNALTPDGSTVTIEARGFEAIVLQHEIDHLDGLLFLDRVSSLKTDVFRRVAP